MSVRRPVVSAAHGCFVGPASPAALAALPEAARTQVLLFTAFLRHHPAISACDCGIPMLLQDGRATTQASPSCGCPCHQAGYVSGTPA
jgi:hypothetical protein